MPPVNICDGLQVRVMADGWDGSFHPARNILAITQTCRQIQEEASLLVFSLIAFPSQLGPRQPVQNDSDKNV